MSKLSLTVTVCEFPARSVLVPEINWFAPSDVTKIGSGHSAMPLSWSVQSKLTVTSTRCHPFALGSGLTVAVMEGGVVSGTTFTMTSATSVAPFPSSTM